MLTTHRLAEKIQVRQWCPSEEAGQEVRLSQKHALDSLSLPGLSPTVQPEPSSVLPEQIPVADKSDAASPSPETSVGIPGEASKVLTI